MRYATPDNWAKYFRDEGAQISCGSIRNRLHKAKIIGITARNKLGTILKNSFYAEIDVRKACTDLLKNLPQADETGFFKKDDIKYGTIRAWVRILPVSHIGIIPRLKQFQAKSIKGKDKQGKIYNFYSETDVRSACADLLENLPQADETGFFEKDGIRYSTIVAWSRVLPISQSSITSRLKQSQVKGIKGKDKQNKIWDFYSESDIRSACVDLLDLELHHADENGFFKKDDIKYGSISAWSKILTISHPTIVSRLKKLSTKSIKGKTKQGIIQDFYSEFDVLSTCADLLQDLPQADKDNFFEKDGIKYGTILAWSRVLPISNRTISSQLKKFQIKSIKGKDIGNRIFNFYSESDVFKACTDLLEKRKNNS